MEPELPSDDDEPELPSGPRVRDLLGQPDRFPLANAVERHLHCLPTAPPTLAVLRNATIRLPLDPAGWPLRVNSDSEPYSLPPELYVALKRQVPQALLRDLHRPVQRFMPLAELREGTEWRLADAISRELILARRLERLPHIEPAGQAVRAIAGMLRRLRSEPWQPLKPDDAPRSAIDLDGGAADFFEQFTRHP